MQPGNYPKICNLAELKKKNFLIYLIIFVIKLKVYTIYIKKL